jgi:hypothetical protein
MVAVTGLAAVGGEVPTLLGNAPFSCAATRALEPLRVQVLLQPGKASGLIHQTIKREVKHAAIISDCAA